MKKLLLSFFTPLLVSLFFFIPQVKADTISCSLPDTYFNFTSDYSELKSTVDSYMQSHNSSYYIILWSSNVSSLDAFIYSTLPTYSIGVFGSNHYFNLQSSSTVDIYYTKALGQPVSISTNKTSLGWVTFTCNATWSPNTSYFIIDTNINFTYTDSSYDWAYTSNYGNFTLSNGTNLPSLINYNTPSPPDSTPLLTQFFDISIEKLQLICDFFTSSYIYLSIFVIFILYFVILLLRRLK